MTRARQSKLNRLIKNLSTTYTRIQTSPVHGVGVFAIQDIPEGVDVFSVNNTDNPKSSCTIDITEEQLCELPGAVQKSIRDFFLPEEKDGCRHFPIPEGGLNSIDVSFFVNR